MVASYIKPERLSYGVYLSEECTSLANRKENTLMPAYPLAYIRVHSQIHIYLCIFVFTHLLVVFKMAKCQVGSYVCSLFSLPPYLLCNDLIKSERHVFVFHSGE